MADEKLLTTSDLAKLLKYSRGHIANKRSKAPNELPPCLRINGRTVRYRLSDVEVWLAKQRAGAGE